MVLMELWRAEGDHASCLAKYRIKGAISSCPVTGLFYKITLVVPAAGRQGVSGKWEALICINCGGLSPLQQWQMIVGVSEDDLLFSCSVWRCVI